VVLGGGPVGADGATVHLVHPLGLHWDTRRVKNDERDATELANRLRRGDLPESWIAPVELRELVRYRAKLTALRTSAKAQVHAVMAKLGIQPGCGEMFGPVGQALLDEMPFEGAYAIRVESLRDLLEVYERELAMVTAELHRRLVDHPGYRAIQAIHGIGPIMAAIFVAEIGDVSRFPDARHLCSWAGLTPATASPTPRCAAGTSPSRAARWCVGSPSRPSCAITAAPRSPPPTCASPIGGGR